MTDAEIGGMAVQGPRIYEDVNAVVGGYLRDLAFAQSSQQKRRPPSTWYWPRRIRGCEGADQTDRMLAAVAHPAVRILAHPRGRITGSRAGVIADWHAVFAAAAERRVAVEIDGDPARQDLDYTLAASALAAGCLFALGRLPHHTQSATRAS
jgi:hypothetical protein